MAKTIADKSCQSNSDKRASDFGSFLVILLLLYQEVGNYYTSLRYFWHQFKSFEWKSRWLYIMKKSLHTDMYLCISINLLKLCKYFKLYHELVVEYDKNLKLNLRTTL